MLVIILIAVIAILIASLVYASRAASEVPSGDDLAAAYSRLVWVSVVGFLAVGIMVVLGFVFVFEGGEFLLSGSEAIIYIILIAVFGLLIFVAWLTISAAQLIGASTEYNANTDKNAKINAAYQDAYMAGALSLGTIIALVLVLLSYYAGRFSQRRPELEQRYAFEPEMSVPEGIPLEVAL